MVIKNNYNLIIVLLIDITYKYLKDIAVKTHSKTILLNKKHIHEYFSPMTLVELRILLRML